MDITRERLNEFYKSLADATLDSDPEFDAFVLSEFWSIVAHGEPT